MKTDPNDWKRRSYFSLVALRGPRQSPKDINMDISILLYVWCMASMTICCVFACSHECACKSRQVLNSLKLSLFFFTTKCNTTSAFKKRWKCVPWHPVIQFITSRLASLAFHHHLQLRPFEKAIYTFAFSCSWTHCTTKFVQSILNPLQAPCLFVVL